MMLLFTREVYLTVWIYERAVWTSLLTAHIVRSVTGCGQIQHQIPDWDRERHPTQQSRNKCQWDPCILHIRVPVNFPIEPLYIYTMFALNGC